MVDWQTGRPADRQTGTAALFERGTGGGYETNLQGTSDKRPSEGLGFVGPQWRRSKYPRSRYGVNVPEITEEASSAEKHQV